MGWFEDVLLGWSIESCMVFVVMVFYLMTEDANA